jgi:Ca2+/H+ antiporter
MKTWIQYFNYKLYKYYISKNETAPVVFSAGLSILLCYILLFDVLMLSSNIFWNSFDLKNEWIPKILILIGVLVILFIYFLVYHRKMHDEIFQKFSHNKLNYKKLDKSIRWFIISILILTLILLIIADAQNHGKLKKPLFSP